ncbi:MAG: GntR family transcriptional regulator [Oscillospiraceae bacterium]|nr:GntR family transcriptional regulator [Oscillospiraceae bacterium]
MISFDAFVLVDNVPIYLQIVGYIKRGIVAGTIENGAEMPSRRMLSALLGVNPNTVQKSYAMLEEEGLIHSRSGAKSCVAADEAAIRRLRGELLGQNLKTVIDAMKQMGMTLEDAQAALADHWEVQP